MKTYQLDPGKFPRVKRNLILTYILLGAVGLLVIYLYIRDALFQQAWGLILLVVLLFGMAGCYALREQKRYWDIFKLTLQEGVLIRTAPKTLKVQIKKADVTKVRMVKNGMIVSTKSNPNALLIPRALSDEDFKELTKTLEKWAGVNT